MKRMKTLLTSYPDTITIVRHDACSLDYFVQLRPSTVKNDGIESNAVEEAKACREFIELSEYGTSNFDNGKLGGLRWMSRGREYAQVAFNFALGSDRIKKAGDRVLSMVYLY